jgi:hypothetical protein
MKLIIACDKAGVCPNAASGCAVPMHSAARLGAQAAVGEMLFLMEPERNDGCPQSP